MEIAQIVLEYLKVLLSAPVVVGVVVLAFFLLFRDPITKLLERWADWKIRFPGGTEISAQTSQPLESSAGPEVDPADVPMDNVPTNLTGEQRRAIVDILRSLTANAYLWEYRYLNYFLVRATQIVLDWFVGLDSSVTRARYDAVWLPIIVSPEQRRAILDALANHHLIQIDSVTDLVSVTPKGREYHEWRGPLPALPSLGGT